MKEKNREIPSILCVPWVVRKTIKLAMIQGLEKFCHCEPNSNSRPVGMRSFGQGKQGNAPNLLISKQENKRGYKEKEEIIVYFRLSLNPYTKIN